MKHFNAIVFCIFCFACAEDNVLPRAEKVNADNPFIANVASGPILIFPNNNTLMDNGCGNCNFKADAIRWSFDWQDISGAEEYKIHINSVNGTITLVDIFTKESSFNYSCEKCYITDYNRNWIWKTKAKVNGQWTQWSVGEFKVEEVNTDCEGEF